MEMTFPICYLVVMVRIFKDFFEGKNFSFFKILDFVERRAHNHVQCKEEDQERQKVFISGVPCNHFKIQVRIVFFLG